LGRFFFQGEMYAFVTGMARLDPFDADAQGMPLSLRI
jgi:hypothetical protein